MLIKAERKGLLTAFFSNGDSKKLFLDGFLLRPMLCLLTDKPHKNDFAMDEIDFGQVHINSHRTFRVFLSNITEVTARWRLNYVSLPRKSNFGYMTKTVWEGENMEKSDDASVFEFSVTEVSYIGFI